MYNFQTGLCNRVASFYTYRVVGNMCSDNYHKCGSIREEPIVLTKGRLIYSAHVCTAFLGAVLVINNGSLQLSRSGYCPPISSGVTDGPILKHRHYVIVINMDPFNNGSPYCPRLDSWIYCSLKMDPYCPDQPIVLLFSLYVTDGAILKHRHYVIMNMEPLNNGHPITLTLMDLLFSNKGITPYCSLTKGSSPM